MRALTAAEMRAVDQATIESGHATGEALMERAGLAVADALERRHGSALALHVLVLCGPGNNGGDGFVAARHLHARGALMRVALLAPRAKVGGEARRHLERMEAAGLRAEDCDSEAALVRLATACEWDHALDAMLGTGARGEPRALLAAGCEVLRGLSERGTQVLAVDLPTGVDADTGAVSQVAVRAECTVTFGAAKRGHFLYPGRSRCGELVVADIGLLPPERWPDPGVALLEPASLAAAFPARDPRAHKGSAGRVVVVGGAAGMTGAAVLAATAAVRAGAGYVRVCAPASVQDLLASHLVEPMVVACGEDSQRALGTSAAERIREELARADALAIGPGLSRRPQALELARRLLPGFAGPAVVDADALFALSPAAHHLPGALGATAGPRVLTPHILELERLTGVAAAELESRRMDAAAEWAARWGCVVVLKGAPTVVADPGGRVAANPTGNPGMATAGMGDVLTGCLAALLAQGLPAYEAACLAVFAHGLAGDGIAAEQGETGLSAGDVASALPRALQVVRESR